MKNKKFIVLGILLVLTIGNVVALGVTPGRNTLHYPDELNKSFSFKILNSENKDFNVSISVAGELSKYIHLHEEIYEFSSDEDFREIEYSLNIPLDEFEPGEHHGQIIISEVKEEIEALGAAKGVVLGIVFFVPYPTKYIESTLEVIEINNKTTFLIPVINKGEEEIENVNAVIDIYSKGKKIDTVSTESVGLDSMERNELSADWLPPFSLGSYQAKVILNYDEKELNFVEDFQIGELSIDVFDLFVEDFELGNIVKLDILVENKWPDSLKEVYANFVLYRENEKIVDINSAPYDIDARSKIRIPLYWDTADIFKGEYTGQLIIKYKEFSSAKNLQVDISKYGIGFEFESGEFVLEAQLNLFRTILISLLAFGIVFVIIFIKFIKRK